MNNYKGQIETIQKREIEYSKIFEAEPKTETELKDMLSKFDEYKGFQKKKNKAFVDLIIFFREINSKYKKDKSVDEQIDRLEKIFNVSYKRSVDTIDAYKEYLITNNKKYLTYIQQEAEKQKLIKDEINKLSVDIYKSL